MGSCNKLQGLIRLKFVAVGKCRIPDTIDFTNYEEFRYYTELLRHSTFDEG